MTTRLILYADEEKVLTKGEVYGKEIYLAEGEGSEEYYEITESEYENLIKEESEHV